MKRKSSWSELEPSGILNKNISKRKVSTKIMYISLKGFFLGNISCLFLWKEGLQEIMFQKNEEKT